MDFRLFIWKSYTQEIYKSDSNMTLFFKFQYEPPFKGNVCKLEGGKLPAPSFLFYSLSHPIGLHQSDPSWHRGQFGVDLLSGWSGLLHVQLLPEEGGDEHHRVPSRTRPQLGWTADQ